MRVLLDDIRREQVLLAVAYGLFLACTSVTLWGGYLQYAGTPSNGGIYTWEYLARTTAFPTSLLAAGFVAYRLPKARAWRCPAVALALSLAGLAAQVACTGEMPETDWLLVIAGACFGWSSGIMFCALQEAVAAQKVFSAGVVVFLAAGISAMLFFAIERLFDHVMPFAVTFGLIFSSFAFAWLTRRFVALSHPMFETIPQQRTSQCRQALNELWRPLLCVAFSAFAIGIVRVEVAVGHSSIGQMNESNIAGLLIASIALLVVWKPLYERVTLLRLYQILFPLTATAFLMFPLFEGPLREIVTSLMFVVFSISSSLMVVSCARTARSQALPPVLVYGLFAGVVYTFELAGSGIGLIVDAGSGFALAESSVVALVAIYLLSLAMIAPQKRNRRRTGETVEIKNAENAASGQASDMVSAHCTSVVEQYGLSKREADVLDLLARGRDIPYIAEELVISKNTVRSHTKNIFAKAGVHSRQELIDLVESIEA